jgi:hypothetical protein
VRYAVGAVAGVAVALAAVTLFGGTHHDGSTGTSALNVPFGKNLAIGSAAAGVLAAWLTR